MKIFPIQTPEQLEALCPLLQDESRAAHIRNFAAVWRARIRRTARQTARKERGTSVRVTLELGREANLSREINGQKALLGKLKLGAARKYAKEQLEGGEEG